MSSAWHRLSGHNRSVKVLSSNTRIKTLSGLFLEYPKTIFPGDVCLFEMVAYGNSYNEMENPDGRSEKLYLGDCFVAPLGNRESGHYISGHVPAEGLAVTANTEMNILSNGGIVGLLDCAPDYLGPTARVRLVGRLADAQGPLNTIDRGGTVDSPSFHSPIVLVAGSGTNIGKTTFMGSLVHELSLLTNHIAAAKITGTGCLEDMVEYRDAGASIALDFPDSGLPSTYMEWSVVGPHLWYLLDRVTAEADLTILEAGGDIIWGNGPEILQTKEFRRALRRIVFIPGEPMAALGARQLFHRWAIESKVTWIVPPFLNPDTFARRMKQLGFRNAVCDSRSNDDITTLATSLMTEGQ